MAHLGAPWQLTQASTCPRWHRWADVGAGCQQSRSDCCSRKSQQGMDRHCKLRTKGPKVPVLHTQPGPNAHLAIHDHIVLQPRAANSSTAKSYTGPSSQPSCKHVGCAHIMLSDIAPQGLKQNLPLLAHSPWPLQACDASLAQPQHHQSTKCPSEHI